MGQGVRRGGLPNDRAAALLVGRDAITVPVAAPPRLDPSTIVDTPTPRLDLPALPVALGFRRPVGVLPK